MTSSTKTKSDFKLIVRGTRGSYPVSGKNYMKYGGSTTCYEVRAGDNLIIIDAGTGIINLGKDMMTEYMNSGSDKETRKPIEAVVLFTHTHIDHIQGLPYFAPMMVGSSTLYIYGPEAVTHRFEDAINYVLNPPMFPITVDEMSALKLFRTISFTESIYWCEKRGIPLLLNNIREGDRVKAAKKEYPIEILCMKGYAHPNNGVMIYKITYNNKSIVVATDTEGYVGGDKRLIDFAKGADLLLHDAGYDSKVYVSPHSCKQGYGHSTMEMAVEVAKRSKVKQLALIHHEPANDDKFVEETEKRAKKLFPNACAAYEGQVFEL